MGPSVQRMLTICSNGSAPLNKMAAMPIYGKTLKKLLRSYDDTRLSFDLFMIWSNLCSSCCGNTERSCMAFAGLQ